MHNHAFSDDTNQVKWHESCKSCANLTHLPTKRSPACPEPRMDTRATCICMTSPPDRTDGETHLRPLLRPCAHPKRSAASVGVHLTSPSQPNEPSLLHPALRGPSPALRGPSQRGLRRGWNDPRKLHRCARHQGPTDPRSSYSQRGDQAFRTATLPH